jgi:hypothetical protein
MNIRPVHRRLIPQTIAGFLFCGGSLFALILLPFVVLLPFAGDAWIGFTYFVCGYLVYFGWFWRAWRSPSPLFVSSLWIVSAIQNILPWVFILHEEHWHLPALHGFQTNGSIPGFGFITFGWWLLASVLSVVALICEFLPRRHDAQPDGRL